MHTNENNTADREIRISRLLNAPVALVWQVWTDPEHIKNWWGPTGFTSTISKMEVQPEGEWDLVMHGPDGTDYKNKSIFKEVVLHKRLVYEHVSAPKFLATIDFEAQGEKTMLHWHMLFETREQFIQVVKTFKADEGLKQNVEKLGNYLLTQSKTDTMEREMVLSRVINAPRELVWKVWTDPAHMAQWWGPDGFTNTVHEMDVRPGGRSSYTMHGPDGTNYPNVTTYKEVERPERMVYLHGTAADDPSAFETTLTLEDEGGKTRLTLRVLFPTVEALQHAVKEIGAIEGGNQTLDHLEDHLAKVDRSKPRLHITRIFNAPRELVWQAWTDPEHYKRWGAPRGFTTPSSKMDLRVGGSYLHCMRGPDGAEFWSTGTYKEVVAPERLVMTDSFADTQGNVVSAAYYGMPEGWPLEMLVTLTFEEYEGKTKMTLVHEGVPAGVFNDMTDGGWNEMMDKLAVTLTS